MADEIFSAQQILDFEAAREVLSRRIRELLRAADACEDEEDRRRLEESVAEVSRRRGTLAVGSPEVRALLAEDTPPVPQPRRGSTSPDVPSPRSS